MARGPSPGEGWAWFGDPKGKGRWGIDTASDVWTQPNQFSITPEHFKSIDKHFASNQYTDQSELAKIKRSLPGWFGFSSYNPETGAVRGYSRHGGGSGVITQGGKHTAEHYGQPGSWSIEYDRRPDGTIKHVVGDYWWGLQNKGKYTQEQYNAGLAKDTPYLSSDPNYQKNLTEQIGRMREDLFQDVQKGKRTAADLYRWDKQYGQEDLAGGKHGTERFSELDSAVKRAQLAQQQQGVVRGGLETERANKGMTLAQRLQSNLPAALQNQPNYTAGQKTKDFFGELTKPETYGKAADIINKGANKVWDVLEAPAQGSSKIKETQDWLWNETAVGRAKDQLLDKASGMLGSRAPAARKFADYLLGDTTTKFSQKEIDDTFRSMQTAGGVVNAPGGIGHGVYGGEDISQLSYNPKTNEVTSKFGYQFQKDVDEATGRYDDSWDQSLAKLTRSVIQPLQGQYATDAGTSAVISSPLIQVSKMLGGAHQAGGEITGSFDLLSPDMKKAVMDQYRTRQKLKLNKARGSTYNPTINRNVLKSYR